MASPTTVRAAVFELLRSFGIHTIFGNPGSTELPLFRDFPDDFRYVLGLQEAVVAGMADGYAQATRNAAVINVHSAVGVGHALGNLFTSYRNQTPLLVIAGQQARAILPFEPFLYATQASEFPKPYVKWSCEPARAEDVPAAVARAYYTAMQAPCGPVFLSVPVDDWDRPCAALAPRQVSRIVGGDPGLLTQAAALLQHAQRPVLVVGAAVARNQAWQECIALAEAQQTPVWVSPMSARNSFPETHRLFAGFLAADRARIVAALQGHDLIMVVGAPVFTYHVAGVGPHIPTGASLVQITDDPTQTTWTATGISIVSDVKLALQYLLSAVAPTNLRPAPKLMGRPARLPPTPFTDAYVLQQIAALRPADSLIVEEAPSSRPAMHDYLPISEPDTFYTCASGGLGFGMPAAVGVALANPTRKVIAVLGDGSSMYAIQALWSAAQMGVSLAIIIINNGCYAALREFGAHFRLAHIPGLHLPQLDFCGLATAQGVTASTVTDAAQLDQALQQAFTTTRPLLLDVVVAISSE